MKCDKCFFCAHIGAGIYADFPVKYCRHTQQYKLPFVWVHEKGVLTQRQLNLREIEDLKIWHEAGCNIHPNTVKKAKRAFLNSLEAESEDSDADSH